MLNWEPKNYFAAVAAGLAEDPRPAGNNSLQRAWLEKDDNRHSPGRCLVEQARARLLLGALASRRRRTSGLCVTSVSKVIQVLLFRRESKKPVGE